MAAAVAFKALRLADFSGFFEGWEKKRQIFENEC
jgi:hypothetical protein